MMEVFGLRDDPFRERHDHEMVGEERKKILKQIVELIEYKATTKDREGDRALSLIEGGYGVGKTFTLLYLQDKVLLNPGVFAEFSSDKSSLKIAVSRFRLLDQGRLESKIVLALYRKVLLNLERSNGGSEFFKKLYNEVQKIAKNNKKDPEEVLSAVKRPYSDIFLKITHPDTEYAAWQWLSAGKLSSKEMKELGVPFKIEDDRNALIYLTELLKLLRICGYNSLVVLADEAEDAINTPPSKLTQLLISLRNIYDEIGEKFSNNEPIISFVYISSFSPETWEVIEDHAEKLETKTGGAGLQPFMERLDKNSHCY